MQFKKLIPLLLCVLAFAFQQQPFAAASETGEWSKAVNGAQGRLIVSEDPPFNGTRMISVYLELRNVSDVLNPLEIYYTNDNTKGMVTNKQGKEVSEAGLPASIMSPFPYWLVLPYDSSLRFRVSVRGYGVPKNAGALLALNGAWLIKPDSNAPYFLQGTFNAITKKDSGERRQWQGTLNLPKVKIPMPPSKAKASITTTSPTDEALHPTAYSFVPFARASLRSLRFRRRVRLVVVLRRAAFWNSRRTDDKIEGEEVYYADTGTNCFIARHFRWHSGLCWHTSSN